MQEDSGKRTVHWGVKLFVLFHLFAVLTWCLPEPPERVATRRVKFSFQEAPNYFLDANNRYIKDSPIKHYMQPTGIWQGWNMFSPNPADIDIWYDMVVTYQDRTEFTYKYPHIKELPIFQKYVKERHRKFVENSQRVGTDYKWPAIAQSVAYKTYTVEGNPPVIVELRRHVKFLAPPADGVYRAQAPERPEDYKTETFFTYIVDQEKLKERARS